MNEPAIVRCVEGRFEKFLPNRRDNTARGSQSVTIKQAHWHDIFVASDIVSIHFSVVSLEARASELWGGRPAGRHQTESQGRGRRACRDHRGRRPRALAGEKSTQRVPYEEASSSVSAEPRSADVCQLTVYATTCESAVRGQRRATVTVPRCHRAIRVVGPPVEQGAPHQRRAQVGPGGPGGAGGGAPGPRGNRRRRSGGEAAEATGPGKMRPVAHSKAATAAPQSESVRLSGGSHVSPPVSRRRTGPTAGSALGAAQPGGAE